MPWTCAHPPIDSCDNEAGPPPPPNRSSVTNSFEDREDVCCTPSTSFQSSDGLPRVRWANTQRQAAYCLLHPCPDDPAIVAFSLRMPCQTERFFGETGRRIVPVLHAHVLVLRRLPHELCRKSSCVWLAVPRKTTRVFKDVLNFLCLPRLTRSLDTA